jgi:transposase
MTEVTTIGIDLANSVFHLHGVDGSGETVIRKKSRRGRVPPVLKKPPPGLVGMEARATARHWAREITAPGHEVRRVLGSMVLLTERRGIIDGTPVSAAEPDRKSTRLNSSH